MQATANDLRLHSKQLLETIARGEEVIITYRGKPYAKLVPINNEQGGVSPTDHLFGIWKDYDAVRDVESYVRNLRKGRSLC